MSKKKVILLTVVLLIATPFMNDLVNESRGYEAVGGECLVWLFPILIYGLIDTFRD